jgi:drug/metabolite transporter (DMT)-like permease
MRTAQLVLFALLLASGQILFKKAALAIVDRDFILALINPWTFAALALYGIATVLWILILRTTPLSTAYPFAALGFVIVPLAASFMFGEPLTARYAMGVICIFAGVLLTSA